MKVLILEDDPVLLADAALLLELVCDDEVYRARNADEAIKELAGGLLDGVICDLVGTGGSRTVKLIRGVFKDVPVAVYTGLDEEDAGDYGGDPLVRVLVKGESGPLEAREALKEMRTKRG